MPVFSDGWSPPACWMTNRGHRPAATATGPLSTDHRGQQPATAATGLVGTDHRGQQPATAATGLVGTDHRGQLLLRTSIQVTITVLPLRTVF